MAKPPPGPIFIFRGHEGSITALHFVGCDQLSPAVPQQSLISGSDTGEIFVWNLETFRYYHRLKVHGEKVILWINYLKNLLYTQGKDGIINIWSYKDNWEILRSLETSNIGFCASQLLFENGNSYLASASEDKSAVSIYDCKTGGVLYSLKTQESELGMCMCLKIFQKETKNFIIGGYENGSIQLWDCDKKTTVSNVNCHKEPVMCLDYDSNFKSLGISGSVENTVHLWKISEQFELNKDKVITVTNSGINCIKIRDDGKIVLLAGLDGYIRIFSWKTLKPLAVLTFHSGSIQSLQCFRECVGIHKSLFASGGKDKNVVLWSLY